MALVVVVLVVVLHVLVLGSVVGLTVGLNRARGAAFVAAPQVRDTLEAAFLAGGPGRVADTAVVAMCLDGQVTVADPGIVAVLRPRPRHPVEQAVLDAYASAPSGSLHGVRTAVMRGPAVQALGDSLAARGLLVRPEVLRPLRRWAALHTVGCLVALPASVVLTVLQYTSGGSGFPVPFVLAVFPVVAFGIVLGVVSALRARGTLSVTGRRALRSFAASGAAGDPVVMVAVGGPRALPDPVLRGVLLGVARRGPRPAGGGGTDAGAYAGAAYTVDVSVTWCGGGGHGCGGSSCGGSSGGCGGSSGSSCGGSSGSSCGGGSGGGGGCGGGS